MTTLTNEEADTIMSEIGMRRANEITGRLIDDDKIDDDLAAALVDATQDQRLEVADIMLDILGLNAIFSSAIKSGDSLDPDEVDELRQYVGELERDSSDIIAALVSS